MSGDPKEAARWVGRYAQVTLAISDCCPGGLEGFAPLSGPLPASVFADAVEDGQSMSQSGDFYSVFVDLMDEDEIQVGEKCISLAQAGQILGLSPEGLPSLGRQRLAQINDSDAEHIASRKSGPGPVAARRLEQAIARMEGRG